MDSELVTEIVAAHGDRLATGESSQRETFLALFPGAAAELEPLLRVAEAVAELFLPVYTPDPEWREALKRELLATYRQKEETFWRRNSGTLAAVGVGGAAVAVAGLIAYWRVRRLPPAA